MAVADQYCRVRGMEGLRVADWIQGGGGGFGIGVWGGGVWVCDLGFWSLDLGGWDLGPRA